MRAPLALVLALRELRSGTRGFRVFLACLALGVAAIAAAGSVAEAFRQGLGSQAREILGGDISVSLRQQRFSPAEHAALNAAGRTAFAAASQAMAEAPSGQRRLVELRGVDDAYPLAGRAELSGAPDLAAALAPAADGTPGAAVEQALLDRLGLKLGDRFLAGQIQLQANAVLVSEADRLARGFALGPRVLTRLSVLERGGFLEPGLPYGETARVALAPGADLKVSEDRLRAALIQAHPDAAFRLTDRNDAAPGLKRLIDSLEYFLAFIGLSSLVAGGLGVQGAVTAHLETRRASIAVMKALGAEAGLVRGVYGLQIGLLACAGVVLGLVIGGIAPLVLGWAVRDSLPVPALFALYPAPLLKAAAFGVLAAASFSLAPLARARTASPAELFRQGWGRGFALGPEAILAAVSALGLAGLAVAAAPSPLTAAGLIGGVAVGFGLLWALGLAAAWAAGRLRAGARGAVRLGLANLSGPGSAARTAAPAIGLGVALLAAVVFIQSALLNQVSVAAPRKAPSLVFSGVPAERGAEFDAALAAAFGRRLDAESYMRAPFASGRITAVRGVAAEALPMNASDRWAYDHDISITLLNGPPRQRDLISGSWWPAGYAGPPLAAVASEAAKGGRLRPGDAITLEVLGQAIEARVAAIRKVDFAGFGANTPVVLNAAALADTPLRNMAIARATPAEESRALRALGAAFPMVNVISVREALESAAQIFDRLALAVRGAAAVACLAGLLVLTGAITARARARAREAAVLKVLGASRAQILAAYGVEYGAVGLIAGLAGVALGAAAAWPVVVFVFEAQWSLDWGGVAGLVLGSAGLAGGGGLAAAAYALSRRPAPTLRAPE